MHRLLTHSDFVGISFEEVLARGPFIQLTEQFTIPAPRYPCPGDDAGRAEIEADLRLVAREYSRREMQSVQAALNEIDDYLVRTGGHPSALNELVKVGLVEATELSKYDFVDLVRLSNALAHSQGLGALPPRSSSGEAEARQILQIILKHQPSAITNKAGKVVVAWAARAIGPSVGMKADSCEAAIRDDVRRHNARRARIRQPQRLRGSTKT